MDNVCMGQINWSPRSRYQVFIAVFSNRKILQFKQITFFKFNIRPTLIMSSNVAVIIHKKKFNPFWRILINKKNGLQGETEFIVKL